MLCLVIMELFFNKTSFLVILAMQGLISLIIIAFKMVLLLNFSMLFCFYNALFSLEKAKFNTYFVIIIKN